MASVNIEDKKADDEAPVQTHQDTKSQDTSQAQMSGKEVTVVPDKQEGSSADGGTDEVNGDAKADDKKADPEIKEVGDEQGTAANDEVEETNSDNKGEGSGDEEAEGDNEVETEGEGEREESQVPKKGSKADAKKDKKVSSKSIKNSVEKKGKKDYSLKEPVTPTIERPARERKTVERYSVPSPGRFGRSSASKALSIEKGRGTTLKDIPNVAFKLSKRKADDNLQLLHTILFGKKAKAQTLKRNISQFSGYVWVENEEKQRSKVKEKIEKCVKEKLVDFCDVLNIPINKASVKKEELSAKLLEFLESPHATTDVLLADKEQKVKKRRRSSSGKAVGSGESAEVPAKKQKSQPTKKRKHTSDVEEEEEDDKVEASNEKDVSQDKEDDDDDATASKEEIDEKDKSDEDEKTPEKMPSPKKPSKKAGKDSGSKSVEKSSSTKKVAVKSAKEAAKSTKKSSSSASKKDAVKSVASPSKPKGSSKKPKVEEKKPVKEKSSGKKQTSKAPAKISVEEQGKGKSSKKAKKEPSREEMHEVVVNILKQVDFNTATLSDILRQLGTHFGVDLMHRKAEFDCYSKCLDISGMLTGNSEDCTAEGCSLLEAEADYFIDWNWFLTSLAPPTYFVAQVTKLKCGEFVVVGLCVNHSVVDGIVAMDGFVHLWDETARSLPFYHFLIGTFSKLKTLP
ncbi:protein DEK [Cucumis melo var. makuwa]|uniref:Protein DEK n=1 Tax=Cucumis melo var. makuwa TaxID=1194695 RepID=A0A5D3BHB4_CUCMM|nr:protein DEK [Cucumis melo var. makuwa]